MRDSGTRMGCSSDLPGSEPWLWVPTRQKLSGWNRAVRPDQIDTLNKEVFNMDFCLGAVAEEPFRRRINDYLTDLLRLRHLLLDVHTSGFRTAQTGH